MIIDTLLNLLNYLIPTVLILFALYLAGVKLR